MHRLPPRTTRTVPLVPYTALFRTYLEGCTAPMRDENQLHAAVVELVALDDAEIKYSTVQNWYPGDENGKGGIYNFVTKRALCQGRNRSEEHTSELQSLMRISYAVFCLKKKNITHHTVNQHRIKRQTQL